MTRTCVHLLDSKPQRWHFPLHDLLAPLGEHHFRDAICIRFHLNSEFLVNLDVKSGTWQNNNVFVLTFTTADDKITINPTKTTPNDVTKLALTSIFARYPARMNIPKVDFLRNQSINKKSQKYTNHPTFGEWFISAYWESWVICILVSSPSRRVDLFRHK